MKHTLSPLLLMLVCALQISCSQNQHQTTREPSPQNTGEPAQPPLYLGSVHQVFPDDEFALIRIIGPRPEEGSVLITHPDDGSTSRMANLVVSSAQHAQSSIIAADIRSGIVKKGDYVYKYRSIAAAPEEEEEEVAPEQETFTLSGETIDLGYVPPEVQARREKQAMLQKQAEKVQRPVFEELSVPQPESFTPEEETGSAAPVPDIAVPEGLPKLDDVPDTISGWDAM